MASFTESIVLSLGGSLIIPPTGIDTDFLKEFNSFIRRHLSKGRRFFIVTGGGATARTYIDGAKGVVTNVSAEDLDWLGIHSSRLNGHLMRTIFRDIARPIMIEKYDEIQDIDDFPIVIGSGWKPGWSTDFCSVMMSKLYGGKLIINMTNIIQVYTADPKKDANAKPVETMSWKQYRAMVGDTWTPGLSTPFDPIAAKLADEGEMKVVVLDGKNLENVEKVIENQPFIGTTIQ